MSAGNRYLIGRNLQPPFEIHVTIGDADSLTAEQLHADMPRIEAAILGYLAEVHEDARRPMVR